MEKIKVLIADDHPVFRYGLRSLLEADPDIEVVGEAENAIDVLAFINQFRPDIVILDIRMPGSIGVDLAHEIRNCHPDTKVLILTAYDEDEYLIDALKAGVHGFLIKNTSHKTLISAIHQAHAGKRVIPLTRLDKVLEEFGELARNQVHVKLDMSDDEIKILKYLALGNTYEEMSEYLYLSESSVKRKVQVILTKMGVKSRTQAVAESIRRGII